MMTFSACLWTGLFPLLQFGTYSHITRDKWLIMLVLTMVSLACAAGEVLLRRSGSGLSVAPRRKRSAAFAAAVGTAAALAAWIILSCLASPLGADSWWTGSSRNEGLLTQLCYLGLFGMFAFARVRIRPVMLSAAAGVLAFCAVVVLQRRGVNVFGLYPAGRSFQTNPEFQGTIGNIDMDVGYLCLAAGLFTAEITGCLLRRFRPRRFPSARLPDESGVPACGPGPSSVPERCLPGAGRRRGGPFRSAAYVLLLTAALAAAVYLIVSMDVQFGLVTLGALALVTLLALLPRKWRLPLLALVLAAVLCAVWFWPGESGGIWELHEILHGREQLSFGSNRIAVWKYSLGLAGRRLWLGNGSDTFVLVFNQYISDEGLAIPTHQGYTPLPSYFDNPHNEYIAHLVNHGLPAMALFLALIISAAVLPLRTGTGKKAKDAVRARVLPPYTAAVICYAVQAFFSFSVPLVAPMFWVILGLCAGSAENGDSPRVPRTAGQSSPE